MDDDWRSAWHSFLQPDGTGVHVRFRESDRRLVIADLYLDGPELTSTTLRSLTLGTIEAQANASGLAALERRRRPTKEPTLAELRANSAAGRQAMTKQKPKADGPSRPRLTRPTGTDQEAFYRALADAYREYAGQTRAVAVKIAEEAGVPVPTAHRWIREARLRGALPAGRKGRAG